MSDPDCSNEPASGSVGRITLGRDALPVVSLVVMSGVAYSASFCFFWTYDDAFHLHFLLTHRLMDILIRPAAWHGLPFRMFTPLLFISYGIDRKLFGLDSFFFQAHQLLALAVAACLLYAVFRLWSKPLWAWFGAMLFIFSLPVVGTVSMLMLRHYLEGLALASASAITLVNGVRKSRNWEVGLSSLLYFLACAAKEVFIPLIIVFFFIPELRGRRRRLLGHGVAVLLFVLWRFAMIGTFLGGYGFTSTVSLMAMSLPKKMYVALFGGGFLGAALATVIVIACAATFSRSGSALTLLAAATLAAVGPVFPVSVVFQPRYGLTMWLVIVFAVVLSLGSAAGRLGSYRTAALAMAILGLSFAANRRAWSALENELARMSAEARAFLRLGDRDVIAHASVPGGLKGELKWLKANYWRLPSGTEWFSDDLYACLHPLTGRRLWQYSAALGDVADASDALKNSTSSFCSRVKWEAPLSVSLAWDGEVLSWNCGPYEQGSYSIILGDGVDKFSVPREASYRLIGEEGLNLRFRYDSPQGWTTYSDNLVTNRITRRQLDWSRGSP
jgi:hypothetical protein